MSGLDLASAGVLTAAPDPGTPSSASPGWVSVILSSVARAALLTFASLLMWACLPALAGWHPTTVMTASMAPRIMPGDVVVTRSVAPTAIVPGQVLLVDDPDHRGRTRLHRLVRADPQGWLVLRGDANAAVDSSHVPRAAVHGVGMLRIPWVGLPILWARTGQWVALGAFLAAAALLAAAARDHQVSAVDCPPSSNRRSGRRRRAAGRRPPPLRRRAPHRHPPVGHAVGRSARLLFGAAATLAVALTGPSSQANATLFSTTKNNANTWSALPFYTCAAAVANAAPYLWYRLDDTIASTAVDSSGHGLNGTYQGSGTTTGAARACTRDTGTAVTFNGSGYISTATQIATPPNTFTLETWLKTTSTNGGTLIGFGTSQTGAGGTADRQIYLTNTGKVVFGVAPGSVKTTITSPAAYNNGAWHHIAATLSASGMALYVDGTRIASNAAITTAQTLAGYWRIGYTDLTGWPSQPTSNLIAATLDDTAVYTTALSAATIKSHYNSGK